MAYYYYDGGQNQPPKKKPGNDGLSWALIAVFFLTGLWPVGLALLVAKLVSGGQQKKPTSFTAPTAEASRTSVQEKTVKAESKTESKAESKTVSAMKSVTKTPQYGEKGARIMRIVGAVLAIASAIALLNGIGDAVSAGEVWRIYLSDISRALGFTLGGVGLMLGGWSMKRRARRFAKYLAAAGDRNAVPIQFLADAAQVSEPKAERELEMMVEKGLWGPDAYVDNTRDMLFRTRAAAAEYFAGREKKAPPVQAEQGFSGMLRNIRRANDRIADPVLSAKIDRLEEVTARIFKTIENDPAKREKASTFLNYYLPTTQKVLDSYADFEEAGVSGANLSQAKERIEKTMDNIVSGFEHQLDELYQADAMDVDSDIRVMETMLRRDNSSVEEDFGLGGGTAVQEEWEQE